MIRCKKCGGTCSDIGGGMYECEFCGSVFSGNEIAAAPTAVAPAEKASDSGADVFDNSINGILEITCKGRKGSWSGSGYLISVGGYAVTNAHVAADSDGRPCSSIAVKLCGHIVSASVVALADDKAGLGRGSDLALIQLSSVPASAKALPLDASGSSRNGEQVYVIGNSLGCGTCITSGIISDRARRLGDGKTYIMTDCAVNGGNSGGPIFNCKGQVIGTIVSRGLTREGTDAEGMNYAVPVSELIAFLNARGIKI